jgi:hypothetical protein
MSEHEQHEKQALKKEILEELKRRESIKEILRELQPQNQKRFSDLLRHPILLLVLGFLFTGVIGAWLTSYWKTKEWDYQQKRLRYINQAEALVKRKTEIRDEVRKDTETVLSAHSEIVALILAEANTNTRSKDMQERITRWQQSVDQWNTNLGKLRQTISSDFSTPTCLQTLEQSGKQLAIIVGNIKYVIDGMKSANWRMTAASFQDITTIKNLLRQTQDAVRELLAIMAREIQAVEAIATQPI